MTQDEERAYVDGQRQAWGRVAAAAALNLWRGEATVATLLAEREQAIAALRSVCRAYGDNDWDGDLHLADIIEKHLGRPLDAELTRR